MDADQIPAAAKLPRKICRAIPIVIAIISLPTAQCSPGDAGREAKDGGHCVVDMAGNRVCVAPDVKRIVLIRGRDLYHLAALLGPSCLDRIAAWGPDIMTSDRDAYDAFLARYPRCGNIPVIGSIYRDALSAEAIVALKPDLVILDVFMEQRKYKSVDRLREAGLALLFTDFSSEPLRSPQKSLLLLGDVFKRGKRAREIVDYIDARLAVVRGRLFEIRGPRPSVYLESGNLGPSAYGVSYGSRSSGATAWGAVLEEARCRNIAVDMVAGMSILDREYLLKSDPDLIIITGAHWRGAAGAMRLGYGAAPSGAKAALSKFRTRPGWDRLKAVRSNRVYGIFHGFCMHLFNFTGLMQVAKWTYPGEFKDLDPEAELKEFHRRFSPVPYSGTWMTALDDE